jgi:hypothetical protein
VVLHGGYIAVNGCKESPFSSDDAGKTRQCLSEINKPLPIQGNISLAGECNVKRWALRSILSYFLF